jgi:hypothetical protein
MTRFPAFFVFLAFPAFVFVAQGQEGRERQTSGTLRAYDAKANRICIRYSSLQDKWFKLEQGCRVTFDDEPANLEALHKGQFVRVLYTPDEDGTKAAKCIAIETKQLQAKRRQRQRDQWQAQRTASTARYLNAIGSELNAGREGEILGTVKVIEVVSDQEATLDLRRHKNTARGLEPFLHDADRLPIIVRIRGISTKDLVDGKGVELPGKYKVSGTTSYVNVQGSKSTVFVLEPASLKMP